MAAVMAHQPGGLWRRRASQGLHIVPMNTSSIMSSFEVEASGDQQSAAPRAFQQSQLQPSRMELTMPAFPSPGLTSAMMQAQSLQEAYGYGFTTMPTANYTATYNSVFAFHQPMQYPMSSDLPPTMTTADLSQSVSSFSPSDLNSISYSASDMSDSRTSSNTSVSSLSLDLNSDSSPYIKSEVQSPVQPSQLFYDTSSIEEYKIDSASSDLSSVLSTGSSIEDGGSVAFNTDVDTLMKAIQAKTTEGQLGRDRERARMEAAQQHGLTRHSSSEDLQNPKSGQRTRKKYQCSIPGCGKLFYQKTHLEIHTRAHTGVKPFLCKEPSCGQRFSQLGNLKTHERRHTGERPYPCDICGKSFAQRGNVRAHKIVHMQIKPFTCKLDGCGKMFTQLGNLKSHQNKFHPTTLRTLTLKFSTLNPGDIVSASDKELWKYFAGLYKNSNKGIKGRGKGRGVSFTGTQSEQRSLTVEKREEEEEEEEEQKVVLKGAEADAGVILEAGSRGYRQIPNSSMGEADMVAGDLSTELETEMGYAEGNAGVSMSMSMEEDVF